MLLNKPLGQKAYGHIPHLPGSRIGPGDHHCHEGQNRIATEKVRDKHDIVIVQEKLDGSCCAVAKIDGKILALGRSGYLAQSSKFEQHQLFAAWVRDNWGRFDYLLNEGERAVGEWLAQAHGTRYTISADPWGDPFVVFDIMLGHERKSVGEVTRRADEANFLPVPRIIHVGDAFSVEAMLEKLEPSGHGAIDPVEGAVWRIERKGKVDFLCKWVRPDKIDGCYLPEVSSQPAVWNWHPDKCREKISA